MERFDRLLWRGVDGIILLAVTGMICLIALQVGSRLFGASVPWTEELSRFLFIWTVWLGLAASFRAGSHPALELLPKNARGPLGLLATWVPVVATVILFAAVTWFGLQLLRQQISFGEQSAILQIGMWWATLPLVLGSALSIIGVTLDAIRAHAQADSFEQSVARAEEHLP